MEIGRLLFYVIVNYVVCIAAKSVSLNDLIEAESQQSQVAETSTKLEGPEPTAQRFSLGLKPISRKFSEYKRTGSLLYLSKKLSPLKYRKTFQIKSPLKPKRIKQSLRTRHKRKNQSFKREITENVKLKQKYIPLLRSIGMLFDDILGSDSGESFEVPQSKRERLRFYFEGDNDAPCKCASKTADSQSGEEATSTEDLSTEVSSTTEITTEAAHLPTASDVRGFRQHKIVPLLLPRNTFGARRNNNGLRERSRPTHNWSAERHISGDHGDSEYDPERGQDGSGSSSDEEFTDSDPRDSTSSVRFGRIRDGQPGNITEKIDENVETTTVPEIKAEIALGRAGRLIGESKGKDELEVGRHEEKSAEFIRGPVRRQREFLSEDKIGDTAESVQSEKDNEESYINVTHNSSSDKRIIDGNGIPATEAQKTGPEYKNIVHHVLAHSKDIPKLRSKVPVVTILDGYSVTRHKNGENKLSEKAIHIRSN